MTLIFEIAAGIVLGVAIIAIIAACWEQLLVALMALFGLAVTAAGVAFLYVICGSWENLALAVSGLGITGATVALANCIESHEKYGPSLRAMASTVAVAVTVVSFTSLLILAGNSHVQPYLAILPGMLVSALSARFFYRYALRKELSAREESA